MILPGKDVEFIRDARDMPHQYPTTTALILIKQFKYTYNHPLL